MYVYTYIYKHLFIYFVERLEDNFQDLLLPNQVPENIIISTSVCVSKESSHLQ